MCLAVKDFVPSTRAPILNGGLRRIQGEHLCYAPAMGQPRKCVVRFRDGEGVEHGVEVTAESLYEAGAGTLRVEVCESTFYNVKVAELEVWLKRSGGAPRDVAMRRGIQARLAKSGSD